MATKTKELTELSDLELAEHMTNAGDALNGIDRQARQVMGEFQMRKNAILASMEAMQTELNIRIAKKNGTKPKPVHDQLSATRQAQVLKNQAEEHRRNFPPPNRLKPIPPKKKR